MAQKFNWNRVQTETRLKRFDAQARLDAPALYPLKPKDPKKQPFPIVYARYANEQKRQKKQPLPPIPWIKSLRAKAKSKALQAPI